MRDEPLSSMDSYMPDYGLFEASRIACPVLPQYHPKQLMELLNSGKIRWVKAILAHLVRSVTVSVWFIRMYKQISTVDYNPLVCQSTPSSNPVYLAGQLVGGFLSPRVKCTAKQ